MSDTGPGYVARYEPYGKLINATPTGYPSFPIRFAGYWYDSQTSLYKVGLRYYDPDTGRWTQRDPLDNPLELRGWNRYIYAGDDPSNPTDPSGMTPFGRCEGRHMSTPWVDRNHAPCSAEPQTAQLCRHHPGSAGCRRTSFATDVFYHPPFSWRQAWRRGTTLYHYIACLYNLAKRPQAPTSCNQF